MIFQEYERIPMAQKPLIAHMITKDDHIISIGEYRYECIFENGTSAKFFAADGVETGDYIVALDNDTDFEDVVLINGDYFEKHYKAVSK